MEAHLTVIFKNKPLWYIAAKIHWNTLETLICYVFVTVYKIWHSIQPCPNNSPSQGLGSIKFQPWGIPLVAAVCNIVILISYCSVLKRLCWLLHGVPYPRNRVERRQMNEANPDGPSLQFHSQALESSITQSLPISQFKKNNEEQNQMHTDCAVCLGEFEEGEWLKISLIALIPFMFLELTPGSSLTQIAPSAEHTSTISLYIMNILLLVCTHWKKL